MIAGLRPICLDLHQAAIDVPCILSEIKAVATDWANTVMRCKIGRRNAVLIPDTSSGNRKARTHTR